MPATKPTKRRAAYANARVKRKAIADRFGNVEINSENLNFLYRRRHLTIVRDPVLGGRELKYVIEFDNLEQTIRKTLDRIRKRDGIKIFKEVADRLISGISMSLEVRGR